MKILVVGGGSGGHVTPAIAVVREILRIKPRARVEFWTDRKYYKNVVKITTLSEAGGDLPMRVRKIASGKFMRYAGWGIGDYLKHLDVLLVDVIFKNICGLFGVVMGIVTSFARMIGKKNRPDVVFLKGGYVGVPVGIVARVLRIPYIIHESDVSAGLANRILMRKARVVAMGARFEKKAGRENWEWVGVPIGVEFRKVSETRQAKLKEAFGFCSSKPLVVITGGSQGSEHINEAVKQFLPELLEEVSVGLIAGRKRYEQMMELKQFEKWGDGKLKSDFRMWEFNSNMDELLGAADVVVSRAGATTIAELEALGKAVILVPFERLPGGHQVKNAEKLRELGALEVIYDEEMVKQPSKLKKMILELAGDKKKRKELAEKLNREAKVGAAKRLAEIIVEVGGGK